jgi:hypothetical protein
VTKRPVLDDFMLLFPATLELSLCAIIVAIVLGIPAGVFAAVKRGTWLDQSIMGVALSAIRCRSSGGACCSSSSSPVISAGRRSRGASR